MTSWRPCSLFLLIAATQSLISIVCATADRSPSSPPVNVRLQSPWDSSPLLLEALEAAYDEDSDAFWPLLSHVSQPSQSPESTAPPAQVYDVVKKALDDVGVLSERGSRDNWEMALALHSQSPKVAAFWQVARTTGAEERWAKHVQENGLAAGECESWVDWYGRVVCSETELQVVLSEEARQQDKVATYPFDHVHPSQPSASAIPTAVLYGRPLSPNFHSLHTTLFRRASAYSEQPLRYVLRWRPDSTSNATSGFLAGYGAALDLKKVDYLVIDDRKLTHAADAPSLSASEGGVDDSIYSQLRDRQWLDDQLLGNGKPTNMSQPLEEAEISRLGLQAVQTIIDSQDPLRAFAQLTQDFPLHAPSLARGPVTPSIDLDNELHALQMTKIRPGMGDVWLNGKPLSKNEQVPLGLLKVLRKERALVDSILAASSTLGLNASQAIDLLSQPSVGRPQTPEAEQVVFLDASDRIERSATADETNFASPITWWNDIEQDEAFADLRQMSSLRSLLRPMHPSQFPQAAKNLFNVVLTLDLADRKACSFLAEHVAPLLERITVRWGLVPAGLEKGEEADSTVVARLYWHLWENHGLEGGVTFLHALAASGPPSRRVDARTAQKTFTKLLARLDPSGDHSSLAKEVTSVPSSREEVTKSYVRRLRLTIAEEPRGHVLVNGQHFPLVEPRSFFQLLHQVAAMQLQQIARPIYFNEVTDDDDVSTWFYDLPLAFASRSELVFPTVDAATGQAKGPKVRAVDLAKALAALPDASPAKTSFLYPTGDSQVNATMWVIADFDTEGGVHLLREAVSTMVGEKAPAFRLGFIHTVDAGQSKLATPGVSLSGFIAHLAQSGALDAITPSELLEVLKEPSTLNDAKLAGWNVPANTDGSQLWDGSHNFFSTLGLDTTAFPALLINGRLLSHLSPLGISSSDLSSLVKNELARRIDPVVAALHTLLPGDKIASLNRSALADSISIVSSAIAVTYYRDETQEGIFSPPSVQRTNIFDRLGVEFSRFEVGDPAKAKLRFQAIVDPLTETAQRWSSLFQLVATMPDVHLQVIMNPVRKLQEMPLKRFYRYSAPSRLRFDAKTGEEVPATLSFQDMPQDAVLTMGLDAPPAWLTMASEAVYDLDNIRLRDVPEDGRRKGVLAVYELKHLLIEGHAREAGKESKNAIPRGLQLELQTPDGSETLDTIVMANLAYFQFRARPGLYRLRIRPGGKSEELYEMRSVGNLGWDSPGVEETGDDITLDSLDGLTIYPRVVKREGKEKEELLVDLEAEGEDDEDEDPYGEKGAAAPLSNAASGLSKMLHRAADSVKSVVTARPPAKEHDRIHIFTVASGHLYERMTYIMILSVLRHTQSLPVKFWFIENFLSPSFKSFIPHLAQAYNFEYELVTYAWPHWLRAQTEKQRTIWGYKILFLDVLFPLDVEKVIFVDSDQVVRADMKELLDVDLKGAPYGFPPMGDDSEDMDGYRFWKRGFWKDFLRGRPYHISALYVVDLNRFRQVAAGDKLRGQYQALSADAGSLANLDQDLPQTLMFNVPLHTLDQRWLWCETWCSHDWLHEAKTIDLCSNPKTHEAKLDRARRQIPEWTELDEEVQALARRVGVAEGAREAADAGPGVHRQHGEGDGDQEPRQHDEL
ncbi:hypothetical protein BDZ90DRAFT_223349 [Jaminaea rosea]|uniref:Glycosyltransferase family 24 protein n=1 Tax=Jaminaea rosea TaxID=1569628 RepID=A0A316UKY7_9BASI|nr:hypothetical protein BDZ90DRAFT_223349 [Jaminaea rosea]PWN25468.1 hypothetical protein BDZ90DRAFT_223349 [Jaminaea rosea]